jgi:hypothetical protein
MRCNNQYDQLQQELVGASYKLRNKLLAVRRTPIDRSRVFVSLSVVGCPTTHRTVVRSQVKMLNANTYTAGMISGRRASIRSFWHSAHAGTLASMYLVLLHSCSICAGLIFKLVFSTVEVSALQARGLIRQFCVVAARIGQDNGSE